MQSQILNDIELTEIESREIGEPLDSIRNGTGTHGNNDVKTRRGINESIDQTVQRTYTEYTGDYITAEGTVRSDDCED